MPSEAEVTDKLKYGYFEMFCQQLYFFFFFSRLESWPVNYVSCPCSLSPTMVGLTLDHMAYRRLR